VLAKVVGDEPPEIVVNRLSRGARTVRRRDANGVETTTTSPGPAGPMPGSLRLSYGGGRYFIRDGMGYLRALREPKASDGEWPKLDLPPRDANSFGGMGASRAVTLSGQVTKSWITVVSSPQAAARTINGRFERTLNADCLVRLTHVDLHGGVGFSGSAELPRATCGEWFVLDDGDLLYAQKLDAWRLPYALEAQAQRDPALAARLAMKKLGGLPVPEPSGESWLNAEKPPRWQDLRGKPVLLVLFDLKQASFLPLVPPLLGFEETYSKQGLAVIGVHANHPRDEVEKKLADERITFPVLIDDGKTAERYGIGFSACLLIDREGRVVSVYKDSLAPPAEIEELLEEENK
ncbi:MAG TPA: redoxin domain-containing protein, partial [Pirellulales bacterium]|nr:redoxin domain-containing protein [Pirellulales bacterium]